MRLWSLILLFLLTVGLRAGEETVPATTPAPAPVPATSSAPAPVVTPAPAAAVIEATAAPTYTEYHLANKLVQADIIDWQGAIRRISLLETHPIHLPAWRTKVMAENGQQAEDPAKPLAVLSAFSKNGANHNWISGIGLEGNAPWTRVSGDDHRLVLSHDNTAKGLRYTLTYELPEDALALRSALTVENIGSGDATIRPAIYPLNGVHQDDAKQDFAYLALAYHNGGTNGKLTSLTVPTEITDEMRLKWSHLSPKDQQDEIEKYIPPIPGDQLDYVCLKSRFFAALWHPLAFGVRDTKAASVPAPAVPAGAPGANSGGPAGTGGPQSVAAVTAGAAAGHLQVKAVGFNDINSAHQAYIEATLLGASNGDTVLKPGQAFDAAWTITVVSMKSGDIKRLGDIAAKVEYTDWYYRFFKSLAWLLTISLDALVLVVINYGAAVVILTFLLKLLMHRFTFKQHESMMKMQKLAPEQKLIQEQFKNDRQKMGQKQMELWKKHGVNPLGGCLPLFIQLPIFTALYLAFCHSADMRSHGFLWINDLTLADQLWYLGFQIPAWFPLPGWGGQSATINPLPIIYIGVSIWMSLMQKVPPGADPQQEQMMKMMRWLPVIFGVFFYFMPSGLVLYFTVNAVLSTIEIKMVRKKLGMH